MGSLGSAAVHLADAALRRTALAVLAERGYAVAEVDGAGALEAVRAGILTLLEIGPRAVAPDDLARAHQGRLMGLARPILVAVDPGDREQAVAALAAGATGLLPRPFDDAALHLRLVEVERWTAECGRFHAVLEHLPDRLLVFDRGGRVLFDNRPQGTEAIDRLVGGPTVDNFAPPVGHAVMEAIGRARDAGRPEETEVQAGEVWCRLRVIPLEHAGTAGAFAVVATDVTGQRRTEADLRASSVEAAALLDALPDMVFRMTGDGTFLDFRAESVDMLVSPPDQIIGHNAVESLGPELGAQIALHTRRALETGSMQRFEYSLQVPQGVRDFEARIIASGPDEVFAIVRDMTEPKRMQARLAVAERLAALGTLSAGVAHEINNPLTYVLIGIESVLKELRRAGDEGMLAARLPVFVERLEGAMEGARRVRRIVSDLRTFGRPDETDENARPIDVRTVLDAAAAMVDSEIRYRARVIREYREVPMTLVSPDRLAQVFVNILLNAAQAMPEGDASSRFIRLSTDRDARGRAVVEVEDSGPGIDAEDLDRIFDPFFTTKPVGVGTGLGLWICHSIVTSYGGEISASSRPGEGAIFRIALPPAAEPTVAPAQDEEVQLSAPFGRVLVIDDDPQVVKALAILLDGADVTVATSGRAALEMLARDEFAWIFCDLMMPDLSGMDVYEQVKSTGRGIERRFVFMTGGAFTPRAREFVARVANPCLSKPFHARQVAAVLRQWSAASGRLERPRR